MKTLVFVFALCIALILLILWDALDLHITIGAGHRATQIWFDESPVIFIAYLVSMVSVLSAIAIFMVRVILALRK